MIPNTNYNNLKESYLFYHIAQKTKLIWKSIRRRICIVWESETYPFLSAAR